MSAASALWHPCADMPTIAGHDLVIASGHGSRVRTEDGREFLDATASGWFCNVGHGREQIGVAVAQQMQRLASYSNVGGLATRPTLDLADRLSAVAAMPDAKVLVTGGGSDAVHTAVTLVRRYWGLVGEPERTIIITRTRSGHVSSRADVSPAGTPAGRDGHALAAIEVVTVAWDDAEELAAVIDRIGASHVAAFFCEPVIGAGGVYAAPPGYLDRVRAICRDSGVLYASDEVTCGYGRTGRMFASEGLDPDLVLTGEGLTSGYLPMGAVLVAGRVAEPFRSTPGLVWGHGRVTSGHAAAAAAAMANLDIIEAEDLVRRVSGHQLTLSAALAHLRGHDWVAEVRSGVGLLAAVQLRPEVIADDTAMPRVVHALRERGVLTCALADGSLQVSPPFVVTRDELRSIGAAIDEALAALGSTRPPSAPPELDLLPDVTADELGGFGTSDARLLADVPPHHVG